MPEGPEENDGLVGGEDGRRLVEHEDVRIGLERSGDADPLPGADGERCDERLGAPEVEAGGACEPGHPLPPCATGLDRRRERVEEGEVVGDGRGLYEEVVLRNERDSGLPGRAGVGERHPCSVTADLAGVRAKGPRGDRDERRLPGAVLAEQGVDLARTNDEPCSVEGANGAERPRDARELERERGRGHQSAAEKAGAGLRSCPSGRRARPR